MSSQAQSRWERKTWPQLKRLATEVPEAGIHLQSQYFHLIPQTQQHH
jgi:D-amino-acid oxidase